MSYQGMYLFSQAAVKKMGGGNSIKFWKDVWVGDQSLELRFPRLFAVSVQQDSVVKEAGRWLDGDWQWELLWRRNFFVWEEALVRDLMEVISHRVITDAEDRWMWKPNEAEAETSQHVFLDCRFAADVWYQINRWLGTMVVLTPDVMMSYGQLVGCGGNKKIRKGFSIVWLAFVWVIWRVRNDRVFNNVNGVVEETVDKIQRISWQWYLNKTGIQSTPD
ncbi:hypothetical protein L195_g035244 [Trifolium pratense]|uniref:Uncharacterized protein n=1 Tax=Trifolium pratense TaxID=57577 RepID=A0A2K3LL40_TRIPR|nr:hypothetical protein L195_g035244 [Trifolium pratense]